MGLELECKCKKCGYTFRTLVGVGMLYPKTYAETVIKMKEGQFGPQGKEFFETFPEGAISCEEIVVQCNDCGKLMSVPDLSLYVPKDEIDCTKIERNIPWSSGFSGLGYEYVSLSELDEHYQLFERYRHRCSKCKGYASAVLGFTGCMNENIDRHVKCPECGLSIEIVIVGMWD